jgi:DNA-binding LytR/AlgR family response regulator
MKDKAKPTVLVRTTQNQCIFQNQAEDIYIKGSDKFYKKIHIHDIVYIKADNGGVSVYTLDSGVLFTYTTLTSFLKQYKHSDIIKIHNGHAINKKHISSKSESLVRMIDGTELAIGMKWRVHIDAHFNMIKPKA